MSNFVARILAVSSALFVCLLIFLAKPSAVSQALPGAFNHASALPDARQYTPPHLQNTLPLTIPKRSQHHQVTPFPSLHRFDIAAHTSSRLPNHAPFSGVSQSAVPRLNATATFTYAGGIGGGAFAVTKSGSTVYMEEGNGITILDVSNPAQPVVKGTLRLPLLSAILDLDIVDTTLYATTCVGLAIFDASNPADIHLRSFTSTPTNGCWTDNLVVRGTMAYVGNGERSSVDIFNVSNPDAPVLVGTYQTQTTGRVSGIDVVGSVAYISDIESGLHIVDISRPESPQKVGEVALANAADVRVVDGIAYMAVVSQTLQIVNVKNPSTPTLEGSLSGFENISLVDVDGSTAYVLDGTGMIILDVSNPLRPIPQILFQINDIATNIHVAHPYAYLVGVAGGLHIVDVSQPTAPDYTGHYQILGDVFFNVDVVDQTAYVAASYNGLHIIDVSQPGNPRVQATKTFVSSDGTESCNDIHVIDSTAYVVSSNGVHIIDVSSPTSPTEQSFLQMSAANLDVKNTLMGIARFNRGVSFVDISNPRSPTLIGSYDTPGTSWSVDIQGTYAYVADGESGLIILDISNPNKPVLTGSYDTPGLTYHVQVTDTVAYVGDIKVSSEDDATSLFAIDVSDPTNPSLRGSYRTTDDARQIQLVGTTAYLATTYGGVDILDVRNPNAIKQIANLPAIGGSLGLSVHGSILYVAEISGGLNIFLSEISSFSQLYLPLVQRSQ